MSYYIEREFNQLVSEELNKARSKHSGNIHNHHEAYAAIKEELDEYWDEVKKQTSKRDVDNMLKELVQIAAMCRRTAKD